MEKDKRLHRYYKLNLLITMTKKLLTLLLAVAASVGTMFASDTQVNGIWYDFDSSSRTATVTYQGASYSAYNNEYTGSVVIPASVSYGGRTYSVTSIGNNAFYNCTGLTSVTIGNSVTSIGEWAFYNCTGLTSVTIGNSVTSIGGHAFYRCNGLTSVTIPNSVTSIGEHAFCYCSGLTSVTIPNSVTSIGSSAFYYCKGLTSVTIGNSVKSIGNYAFQGCTGLTSVTIPNSVTSIESNAFSGCTSLTSVTIPNSVTSIGGSAFAGCSVLTSVTLNSNAIVSKNYSKDSNLKTIFGGQVTEYIIGDDVTSIGSSAFQGCSGLTSVTIGNSVTSIGSLAFSSCDGLTSVVWNAKNCSNSGNFGSQVTSFTFGDEVEVIPGGLCNAMTKLTSVTIPNSVTSIGKMAFCSCFSLTSVTIGNSVTSIGQDAFQGCSDLTKVNITDINAWYNISFWDSDSNPLYYAKHLYVNDIEVTNLAIPNSVTSIGNYAFYNCASLTSVTIPNSVTSIGNNAFYNCSSLTAVTIPNSVTSIGGGAFALCSVSTINYIGSMDEWCNKAWSPSSISSDYHLQLNGVLQQSAVIPNSVTSIGSGAFNGCSSGIHGMEYVEAETKKMNWGKTICPS